MSESGPYVDPTGRKVSNTAYRLDPPGALPMPCNYRSDGTSGSILSCLPSGACGRVDPKIEQTSGILYL